MHVLVLQVRHCRNQAARLPLYGHIKTAEQRTIIQQYSYWYTGRWWVGCYIWYSEEGPRRAAAPPSPLESPNVTAHPSTASVPASYYSMWRYNCLWILKGPELRQVSQSRHVWFGADVEGAESTSESSLRCGRASSFRRWTAHGGLEQCQLVWNILCVFLPTTVFRWDDGMHSFVVTQTGWTTWLQFWLHGFSCSLRALHQLATSTMQFCNRVAAVAACGRVIIDVCLRVVGKTMVVQLMLIIHTSSSSSV